MPTFRRLLFLPIPGPIQYDLPPSMTIHKIKLSSLLCLYYYPAALAVFYTPCSRLIAPPSSLASPLYVALDSESEPKTSTVTSILQQLLSCGLLYGHRLHQIQVQPEEAASNTAAVARTVSSAVASRHHGFLMGVRACGYFKELSGTTRSALGV
jgi:hypothetical protein